MVLCRFLSSTQLNLLKLSLSLRTKSPRIEMFQQMSKDRGVAEKGCDAVVEAGGALHCSIKEAARHAKANIDRQPETFKVDHHYLRRDPSAPVVVLYAQPGRKGFAELHSQMKELAERGEVDYVLRPFLAKRGSQKTRMSGK